MSNRRVPHGNLRTCVTALCRSLAVVSIFVAAACAPSIENAAANRPATVTPLAHGIVSAAVVVADDKRILVGETLLGARPADVESRVRTFPAVGGTAAVLATTERFAEITGLALATDGTLYVSRRATSNTSGSGISAYRSGAESVVLAASMDATATPLRSPGGIAVAKSGDLIVADVVGGQVLRVSSTGTVVRLAGTGPCNSSPLIAPTPGSALATALCGPQLVAVDAHDNVYIARKGSRWIAKVDSQGALTLVERDVDVGGIATDSKGTLLVSDATRGEILRYDAVRSIVVSGLSRPTSIAVAPDDTIYVLAEGATDLLRVVR